MSGRLRSASLIELLAAERRRRDFMPPRIRPANSKLSPMVKAVIRLGSATDMVSATRMPRQIGEKPGSVKW